MAARLREMRERRLAARQPPPARSRSTKGDIRSRTRGEREHGLPAGGGIAAHHDVGIAALLEVRFEDALAGRAPARLPLEQVDTVAADHQLA
jgi:hypothetical protein